MEEQRTISLTNRFKGTALLCSLHWSMPVIVRLYYRHMYTLHTRRHACTHVCSDYAHSHTRTSTHICTHMHTHTCTHTHIHTHARTHTHTHARTHACTHARTHTHTHTAVYISSLPLERFLQAPLQMLTLRLRLIIATSQM